MFYLLAELMAVCTIGFFLGGCPCCVAVGSGNVQCGNCRTNKAPAEMTVTIAGISGPGSFFCNDCTTLNGTYVVPSIGNSCTRSDSLPVSCSCCGWLVRVNNASECPFDIQVTPIVCNNYAGQYSLWWEVSIDVLKHVGYFLYWAETPRLVSSVNCVPASANTLCLDDCCTISKVLPFANRFATPCSSPASTATITSGLCV